LKYSLQAQICDVNPSFTGLTALFGRQEEHDMRERR